MKLDKLLFGGFFDPNRTQKAEQILLKLLNKYGKPDCGRNRACFYSKNFVIKFPLNDSGEVDNDWEGSVSGDIYAKTRWINIEGFICVIMEKLAYPKSYKNLPDWVDSIDCMQVGYDRKGRLKAFDFGLR